LSCPQCERYLERDIGRDIGYIDKSGQRKEHNIGMWAHNSQRVPLTPDQHEFVVAQQAAGERLTAERAAAEAQTSAQVIAARQEADMQATMAREQTAQAEARAAELERRVEELQKLVEMGQAAKQYREAAEWWTGAGPGELVPDTPLAPMPLEPIAPLVAYTGDATGTSATLPPQVVMLPPVTLDAGDAVTKAVPGDVAGACAECGTPVRKPARGPVPKRCPACRAKR